MRQMNIRLSLISLLYCITFLQYSCKESTDVKKLSVNREVDSIDHEVEEMDGNRTNIGRAIWQKPGLVIEKLGDISNKAIADIGAGTGYFSFKLAFKAKKVIAIEIEKEMIDYMDSIKNKLPAHIKDHFETRLATPDNPGLVEDEVDIIVIINTIAYIHDLPRYLQTLKKGIKNHGKIMIIDYKMKRLPINAPPKTERIYLDKLEDMLLKAGYKVLETDDTTLDYQYIIQAQKIN